MKNYCGGCCSECNVNDEHCPNIKSVEGKKVKPCSNT